MKLQPANKSTAQVNLKPKLKRPDKDAEPANVPHQTQDDPKFAKQIMGFREWCEKVWDPKQKVRDQSSTTREMDLKS